MRASVDVAHGLSSCGFQALEQGSVVVAHGLSCPEACGILLDQGLNPCLLHWKADSLPLSQPGKPRTTFFKVKPLFGANAYFYLCHQTISEDQILLLQELGIWNE